MTFINFIFIFLLFLLFLKKKESQVYIKSNFDGRYYLVNKINNYKYKSSLLLSIIRHKMIQLTESIKITKNNEIYIKNIKHKIYNTIFTENKNIFPKSNITSYSLNKGDQIILCLYNYKTNKFYDLNTLIYVSIHELAHVANPTIGHDDSFYYILNILLNQAIYLKIYTFYNYEKLPTKYCGIVINSNI
jgi:predicted metal-dependent hydrolase